MQVTIKKDKDKGFEVDNLWKVKFDYTLADDLLECETNYLRNFKKTYPNAEVVERKPL